MQEHHGGRHMPHENEMDNESPYEPRGRRPSEHDFVTGGSFVPQEARVSNAEREAERLLSTGVRPPPHPQWSLPLGPPVSPVGSGFSRWFLG